MARTTTVFDTWHALFDLLVAATWQPHPVTGELPLVIFGDTLEPLNEGVVVVGVPTDRPSSEWRTLGAPSQDESYVLRVVVGTKVPGQSRPEVFTRLESMVAVVETALRDQTTGKPAGGFVAAVGGGVQYMTWRVQSIAPQLYALPDGGFGAYAEVDVAFMARI